MTWDDGVAIRTLYGECRGEPLEAQKAVAHAILNRAKDGRWGKTLAQVCLAKWQFSSWNPTDPNWKVITALTDDNPVLIALANVLDAARIEPDFTGGSMWYYSTTMPHAPIWTVGAKFNGQWGRTRFYSGVD